MNPNDSSIELLLERVENYGITTAELVKLSVIDKLSDIISSLALKVVTYLLLVMFILIINLGIALWLGDLLGKSYFGFFAVALFYAILAFFVSVYGNNLIKMPVSNMLITKLLEQNSDAKTEFK